MASIRVFSDLAALSAAAAREFASQVEAAVAARGEAHVALSGGGTPELLFALLAAPPYREQLSWPALHVWWGDERAVAPDHPQSNYGQARRLLLDHVAITPGHVHRVMGETPLPEAIAAYSATLHSHAAPGAAWPRFDVAVMGMGADGHTASLFPGSISEAEIAQPVIGVSAQYEDRPAMRVSLTPMVFNDARTVIFLVAGGAKAAVLAQVVESAQDEAQLPAQRIQPRDGELVWFVDEAAATALQRNR